VEQFEQPPGLRRQLIERAPQDLVGQAVGELDIFKRDGQVLLCLRCPPGLLERALELAKERDRFDQGQVL